MASNSYIEPPEGLLKNILERIHREERFLAVRRAILSSAVLLSIIIGAGGAGLYVKKSKMQNSINNGAFNNNVLAEYPYSGSKTIFYASNQSIQIRSASQNFAPNAQK